MKIATILGVFLFIPLTVWSESIQVCPSCNVKTIEKALSLADRWDTIYIDKGLYVIENVQIKKPVCIIGRNNPILESKSGDEILTINSDSVSVIGLTLRNVTTSYLKERSAIRVVRHKDYLISNNTIKDCFFGIYLEKANRGTISANTILGNAGEEASSGNGIHAWYCKNLIVKNNTVKGQRDGIYFEFVDNSAISQNLSQNNKRYGLHFMFSNNNEYYDNEFINNGVGVAVMFSSKIIMRCNHFSYNWGRSAYGLLLKEINDAEIEDNIFEYNTIGIFVEGSNRINYSYNNFKRCGWAIKFSGGCAFNLFSNNNLINNSLDLEVNTRLADNKFDHNYWSNYSGYDLNHDGVGDVPYYPVKLFSYIMNQCPETIILMRSLFVDIINFSERVSPVFTPKEVFDANPLMERIP